MLLVAFGLALGTASPVLCSLALLAALSLLDGHGSLVLAPVYGAALLLVGELAQCSIDLRGVRWLATRWIVSRLAASLALVALGACAGALVAGVATIAAARSVALTAVGALATVTAVGTIALIARRGDRVPSASADPDARVPSAP